MRPIARMLDDRYRVVSMDLPGHGRTPEPQSAVGVQESAALVAATIGRLDYPSVTLIGHSNGGRIALFMASDERYEPLIRRLVLISPSGIRPQRSLKVRFKSTVAKILKAPFLLLPGKLQPKGLAWLRDSFIWRMLGSSDYRALSGVMRESFVKTVNCFLEDRIARITVPTLIFWGDQDHDVSLSQIETLARGIPDAGVVTLRGAGHYGYVDDPSTVSAATRHFLESTSD
ncbi:MAG: alpha/beta hydrolase, partial [Rhodothermales bacterium]